MLVLKRRKGEEIVINDEIRIFVTQTSDGGCRLAIDAPNHYRIRRGELPDFLEDVIQQTASSWQIEQ